MSPLDLAEKYMDCVFTTGNWEELRNILADDLNFRGPLYNFDSADAYIASLRADPPVNFKYEIKKRYSDNSSVCLVYQFSKPGVSTIMTQTFDILNGKIKRVLLIFDTGVFSSN